VAAAHSAFDALGRDEAAANAKVEAAKAAVAAAEAAAQDAAHNGADEKALHAAADAVANAEKAERVAVWQANAATKRRTEEGTRARNDEIAQAHATAIAAALRPRSSIVRAAGRPAGSISIATW
jgi:hypothetical protein